MHSLRHRTLAAFVAVAVSFISVNAVVTVPSEQPHTSLAEASSGAASLVA